MLSKLFFLVGVAFAATAHATLDAADLIQVNALLSASEARSSAEVNALTKKWEAKVAETVAGVDSFWTLFAAFLVFFMQAGFGMLEVGSVRKKNHRNILTKNIVDAAVGAVSFWTVGYAFAFGTVGTMFDSETNTTVDDPGAFIGATDFGLVSNTTVWGADSTTALPGQGHKGYEFWVFQWAFAATASTIVSGAVAERAQFVGYLVYTFAITAFIYPVVVHWGWAGGWLADNSFNDFAGSGIVHMTGGVAALMGAIIMVPRVGRFGPTSKLCGMNNIGEDSEKEFQPSSPTFQALGTLILWFGWYGFNPGSTVAIHDEANSRSASLAAINTTLSPAFSVIACLIYNLAKFKCAKVDLGQLMNCLLGGLVGITAGCASVRPWEAALIGVLSCPIYLASSALLKMLKIDDPLDASPVHMFCGAWGVLAAGIFGVRSESIIGIQIGGIFAIFAWVALTTSIIFVGLKACNLLRVSPEEELKGLDVSHHGAIEMSPVINPSVVSSSTKDIVATNGDTAVEMA